MRKYDFIKTEIIPFKNGNLDQFEIKIHFDSEDQNNESAGFVSGFGLTIEKAIIDLADSLQKMFEGDLEAYSDLINLRDNELKSD